MLIKLEHWIIVFFMRTILKCIEAKYNHVIEISYKEDLTNFWKRVWDNDLESGLCGAVRTTIENFKIPFILRWANPYSKYWHYQLRTYFTKLMMHAGVSTTEYTATTPSHIWFEEDSTANKRSRMRKALEVRRVLAYYLLYTIDAYERGIPVEPFFNTEQFQQAKQRSCTGNSTGSRTRRDS